MGNYSRETRALLHWRHRRERKPVTAQTLLAPGADKENQQVPDNSTETEPSW